MLHPRLAVPCVGAALTLASTATAQTQLHLLFQGPAISFGQSVDLLGDVNGDGLSDFLVGAWRTDPGGLNDAGTVFVFSGADGGLLYRVDGSGAGDHMGYGSSLAGDLNNDGLLEICAAADEDNAGFNNNGSVRIVNGADGSEVTTLVGDSASDLFGWATSDLGDVDGDGHDDFASTALFGEVGSPLNTGSVTVYSGANLAAPLWSAAGDSSNDFFGFSVGRAGEVLGDGLNQVIVGAPSDDPNGNASGSAWVLRGTDGSVLYKFDGESASDEFGTSVSGGVDVNRDGFDDLIVGAPGDDDGGSNAGAVYVFSGADGSQLYKFLGVADSDRLGTSVAGGGDLDGDGYGDVIGGAPQNDQQAFNAGALFCFSGKDGSLIFQVNGDAGNRQLGNAASGGEDVDGDGLDDALGGAVNANRAQVFSLRPQGVTHFGAGTPGCQGAEILAAQGLPQIGNADFALAGAPGPAGGIGLLALSDAGDALGSDPLGLGVQLHIALPPISSNLELFPTVYDATGAWELATPIPNDAGLAGATVYLQHASIWGATCGQLLGTSNGIEVTLLP
jgi:hypothetical protein